MSVFMYLKPLISEVLFSNQLDYSGPQRFWDHGPVLWKMIFPETGGGAGFRMIQVHYISFTVHFIPIVITSTSPPVIRP